MAIAAEDYSAANTSEVNRGWVMAPDRYEHLMFYCGWYSTTTDG